MSSRVVNVIVPILSVLLGVLVGAIVMISSGYNPLEGYSALIYGSFGNLYNIGETIRQMTPYVLAGLAAAFAFRTGLFNIGVEGQLIVGWLAAVWVGVSFELPMIIHLPLAILAAALAGGLWAFIPGILKARLKVHEVIVTIMMNYIALQVSNEIVSSVLSNQDYKSATIHDSASLASPFLQELTEFSTMHWGIIIALIGACIMWFLLEKTTTGYELRSVGFNKDASQYAGMNVNRNIILAMVISGMFAGIAGSMEGLGTFGYVSTRGGFTGIGFDGIAVALLGGNSAVGIVLAALLFGALKVGALEMPSSANIPSETVDIVIASIIFFVAANYLIRMVLARFVREGK